MKHFDWTRLSRRGSCKALLVNSRHFITAFPKAACSLRARVTPTPAGLVSSVFIRCVSKALLDICVACVTTYCAVAPTGQDAQVRDLPVQFEAARLTQVYRVNPFTSTLIICHFVHLCACVCVCPSVRPPYPSFGPSWLRSNTCLGFRFHIRDCRILVPWQIMKL